VQHCDSVARQRRDSLFEKDKAQEGEVMSSIDDQLNSLPPSQADPSTLPDAAALLDERLKLLPAGNVSLQELVKNLSKKEGN